MDLTVEYKREMLIGAIAEAEADLKRLENPEEHILERKRQIKLFKEHLEPLGTIEGET